jgi:Flp pilus assembly protein TadG
MKRFHTSRKGVLVVLFALLLPVLLVILGFTIDYANIQRVRNEIRAIADLAAKAAAAKLAGTQDPAQALAAAQSVASANLVNGQPLTLSTDDVVFGHSVRQGDGSFDFAANSLPFNSVQVNAARNVSEGQGVNLFFGGLYGKDNISIAQSAVAAYQDVDIVLVLDRSGSMRWKTVGNMSPTELADVKCKKPNPQSRWRSLDDAINVFVTTLQNSAVRERVGMATFSSNYSGYCDGITTTESTLDQPMNYNLNLIRQAMDHYNDTVWDGATNIFAGLHEGRLHLEANKTVGAKHVIVLLTDGVFNTGPAPFDEAALCKAAGITLHTITFSDQANQTDMITVAENGGGLHYHADTEAELKRAFEQIAGSFAILTQ